MNVKDMNRCISLASTWTKAICDCSIATYNWYLSKANIVLNYIDMIENRILTETNAEEILNLEYALIYALPDSEHRDALECETELFERDDNTFTVYDHAKILQDKIYDLFQAYIGG